jgi:hypothetical protein
VLYAKLLRSLAELAAVFVSLLLFIVSSRVS